MNKTPKILTKCNVEFKNSSIIFNYLLILIVCILPMALRAQLPEVPANIIEQQLESMTENNVDTETEDDSFLQAMQQFVKNPININTANITTLKELAILSPIQLQNIINYRSLFGNFISIYELQAVPGLNLHTIERIRPYITVSDQQNLFISARSRLKDGTHTVLTRFSQVLEYSKGYKNNSTSTNNFYPGSKQKLFVRYKYQFKNLLQYGIVGEKDAGEQFFKGAQKSGFDFYSAHLFIRNAGIIKAFALGDFTVNLGQGLIQWQSLAFKKNSDVTNIKRQLAVLRPYNSAGEINFNRGAGITLAKNNWEATAFISFKNVDANFVADTLAAEDYISSLQTSGFHRTKSEIADKAIQQQFTIGGNIAYNFKRLHVGINAINYQFKYPINKSLEPYNKYALEGNKFGNYSADYSYTFKNLHFFGEAAFTNKLNTAFVNGLIISADSKVDLSFLYRNISKKYQSLYTNAFTENTLPNNENGLYGGITVRPNAFWRLDAFADFYQFPWIKYLVNAPSVGTDYLFQAAYKPNKKLDLYIRYRSESKSKNYNPSMLVLAPLQQKQKQNLRANFSYKLNTALTLRNRLEMVWYDKKGPGAQNGFLSYVDFIIKPMMKKYAGSFRLQYFETDGYDSRMYAYENDVLYSFSIPVFYDKGYRFYVNLNYDLTKKITIWVRCAQTVFKDKTTIGSGLDEIVGNKRTEFKLQAQYQF